MLGALEIMLLENNNLNSMLVWKHYLQTNRLLQNVSFNRQSLTKS